MKLTWTVTAVLAFTNRSADDFSDVWEGLTFDEADKRAAEMIAEHMRKRKASGASITASARANGVTSLVSRSEWK
jgi:hypothetical protein